MAQSRYTSPTKYAKAQSERKENADGRASISACDSPFCLPIFSIVLPLCAFPFMSKAQSSRYTSNWIATVSRLQTSEWKALRRRAHVNDRLIISYRTARHWKVFAITFTKPMKIESVQEKFDRFCFYSQIKTKQDIMLHDPRWSLWVLRDRESNKVRWKYA